MDDQVKSFLNKHYDGTKEKTTWIAQELGTTRKTVMQWAYVLNLTNRSRLPSSRRQQWTKEMDSYLEQHYPFMKPEEIAKRLKPPRTVNDVMLRANELCINKLSEGYTVEALCQALSRNRRTICRYIELGWLKTRRRNTDRSRDFYYVSQSDIYELITNHPNVINHHNMTEERILWTIDILAGGKHGIKGLYLDPAKFEIPLNERNERQEQEPA
jgi:hypothetical protein